MIVFEAPVWALDDRECDVVDDGYVPRRPCEVVVPAPSEELVTVRVWCGDGSSTSRDDEFGATDGVPLSTFGVSSRVSVNRSALLGRTISQTSFFIAIIYLILIFNSK